jgi:hypothetical protein
MTTTRLETGTDRRARRPNIASMLDGLRQLAVGAQLPFLAYLIGVAQEEAKSEKSGPNLRPSLSALDQDTSCCP